MQAYQCFEFVSCEQIFVNLNFKLYITVSEKRKCAIYWFWNTVQYSDLKNAFFIIVKLMGA